MVAIVNLLLKKIMMMMMKMTADRYQNLSDCISSYEESEYKVTKKVWLPLFLLPSTLHFPYIFHEIYV